MIVAHVVFLIGVGVFVSSGCFVAEGFQKFIRSSRTVMHHHRYSSFQRQRDMFLSMGKLRSRQAELQKKMALAKQQNANKPQQDDNELQGTTTTSSSSSPPPSSSPSNKVTEKEMKEINDRKRFEELLKNSQVIPGSGGSDDYMSQEQEEEVIDAYRKLQTRIRKYCFMYMICRWFVLITPFWLLLLIHGFLLTPGRGVDRLFEGDPAPTEVFQELVSIKSENAIGETGAKRLIPWLRKNQDYLVVVCDPRVNSPEFRDTMKSSQRQWPEEIQSKAIFINADTPAENRRWLKKNNLMESRIRLFSDEKREWMQAYTALGENRWSMTLFVLSEERIQKLVRELSCVAAAAAVEKAVKAMEKRKL
jgi:peroxiredoxin